MSTEGVLTGRNFSWLHSAILTAIAAKSPSVLHSFLYNNRPEMTMAQHSCESSAAGDATFASACQTDSRRKPRWDAVVFDDKNGSSQILIRWWNAARLESHSTCYLPLKCCLAAVQIQQGCKKEKGWAWTLTVSLFVWIVAEMLA